MQVKRTFSGVSWESKVGYCRGVKVANLIYLSGTASVDEAGSVFAPGDAYAQAKRCFEIIQKALQDLGADTSCVVRTRMFVTDITLWADLDGRIKNSLEKIRPLQVCWK
ncbi:Rid family hydrolase [Tolypothrix sp. VBCCA 56010]|uniref:Rid family hydrolase n=1 Tax=Tolypothrix sp. VBCCA 56010 TaxID=3137731 RepID=UPI003D7C79AE